MQSTTDIKVRGFQVDVFGHVNHARYVEFFEEARWAFFDQHQPIVERLHARGVTHAVVRMEVNFRCSAKVGDVLRIKTSIKEVRRSSVVVVQEVVRLEDERLIADGEITNVFLDRTSGRPVSVHEELAPLAEAS